MIFVSLIHRGLFLLQNNAERWLPESDGCTFLQFGCSRLIG